MAEKKIAFVTGASRGLGLEIASQLAARDYSVYLGVRDKRVGDDIAEKFIKKGWKAKALKIDVGDFQSIEKCCSNLSQEITSLDVLVNNAGTFEEDWGTLPSDLAMSDLKTTFDVNFFGPFLLLKLLVPVIKNSPAGRVVNISSDMGSISGINDPESLVYDVMGPAYQASKVAINAITALFAKELKDTTCKVNSASPGWCRTDMGTQDAPLSVAQGADTPVWLATLPDDGPTGKFFSATRKRGVMEW